MFMVHASPVALKQNTDILQLKVGHDQLVGEVIRINADQATIQVYEETGTTHRYLNPFPSPAL